MFLELDLPVCHPSVIKQLCLAGKFFYLEQWPTYSGGGPHFHGAGCRCVWYNAKETRIHRIRPHDTAMNLRNASPETKCPAPCFEKNWLDLFDSLFEIVSEGLMITDASGRICLVNSAITGMLGFSREELCGRDVHDFLSPALRRPPMSEQLQADGHIMNRQFLWKHKSGRTLSIEANISSVRLGDGTQVGLVATLRDISDRKLTEEVLQATRDYLEKIMLGSLDSIVALNPSGTIVRVNPAFVEMLGYTREELLGQSVSFLSPTPGHSYVCTTGGDVYIDQSYIDNLVSKMRSVNSTGTISSLFSYYQKKNGTLAPVEQNIFTLDDEQGDIVGSVGIIRDITVQIQAVESLRKREQRFKELADSLPQTVFELDQSGTVTFVNRIALESFGYNVEDIDQGLLAMQLFAPEERMRVQENLRNVMNGEQLGNHEYRALRKDGTVFPCIIHATPIVRENETRGLRGILIDITERKALEEELLKARRLESVAALAGGVAQDFNALLSTILGNINIAQHYAAPDDPVCEPLDVAERNTLRAKELTGQLLTFSRGAQSVKEPVNLKPLLVEAATQALHRSRVICDMQVPDTLRPCAVDCRQIRQVFINLIINAEQAMPEGGQIIIRADNVTIGSGDNLPLQNGPYVKIEISDQSIGILNEHIQNIFDPYFNSRQRGSGIGLATTYTIIKNHAGLICVESEFGTGTTFTIHLPAIAAAS